MLKQGCILSLFLQNPKAHLQNVSPLVSWSLEIWNCPPLAGVRGWTCRDFDFAPWNLELGIWILIIMPYVPDN
jgi:hypothetical protein